MTTDINGNVTTYKAPKKKTGWGSVSNMVSRMKKAKDEAMEHVDELHVYVSKGNKKTGEVESVSLLPVIDCPNCSGCMHECYDLCHDMINIPCLKTRANNSAIHEADPNRYWKEISMYCQLYDVPALRLNIGGDLTEDDFEYLNNVASVNPCTLFLAFTKNYDGVNAVLNHIHWFRSNVKIIMSAWKGMEMHNPYHLPEAHVIDGNGNTTLGDFEKTAYCQGNCTKCLMQNKKKSCWNLKDGENVLFPLH